MHQSHVPSRRARYNPTLWASIRLSALETVQTSLLTENGLEPRAFFLFLCKERCGNSRRYSASDRQRKQVDEKKEARWRREALRNLGARHESCLFGPPFCAELLKGTVGLRFLPPCQLQMNEQTGRQSENPESKLRVGEWGTCMMCLSTNGSPASLVTFLEMSLADCTARV